MVAVGTPGIHFQICRSDDLSASRAEFIVPQELFFVIVFSIHKSNVIRQAD